MKGIDVHNINFSAIPKASGVYVMRDEKDTALYVGKAKDLRSRLRTYFSSSRDTRINIQYLLNKVCRVEYIVTGTDKEALLLENTLIKKYQPRYNIRLRDDKTYVSIRLDPREEWPRLRVMRKRKHDGALWFGPYTSALSCRQTVRFLQKIFPLRQCSDSYLKNSTRPCVLAQVDRCLGPCVGLVDKEEYDEHVKGTILFLKGKKHEAVRILKKRMQMLSGALEFEKAAQLRDHIEAIEQTLEPQRVADYRRIDRDVIAVEHADARWAAAMLHYRDGTLEESLCYSFPSFKGEPEELVESIIGQYYDETRHIPREVLLSHKPEDGEALEEWLTELRGGSVRMLVPVRGEKVRIVEMARRNAREKLAAELAGLKSKVQLLESLRKALHLKALPRHIECFDISNISGVMAVGSMVSFRDGEPDKSHYRRFKIRTVDSSDDYAMMREVLSRRYTRVISENRPLPDLVLLDGGKGQLGIAVEIFRELGIENVSLAAIAKERETENEEKPARTRRSKGSEGEKIYLPGRKNPVLPGRGSDVLHLLQRVRNEAHRFAITYHRKIRKRAHLRSVLDEIPGIGPTRKKALLSHFGSLAKIRSATIEELEKTPGISRDTAESIYAFLHF